MTTSVNQFGIQKSGDKPARIIYFMLMLLVFLSDKVAIAQDAVSGSANMNSTASNWIMGIIVVAFVGLVIYVLWMAKTALHDYGREMELSFPIFRSMAYNSKLVTTVILILVVCGIIWAVNYHG